MTERPFPPLPDPGLTTSVQFGCDGRWWSESQMHDYIRADRAAQANALAALRELVEALADQSWGTRLHAARCTRSSPRSTQGEQQMTDELTDARIFELAKLHFGGSGHGLIWEDNAEYADAVGIPLGSRWIVPEVRPEQTIAFARAILAAQEAERTAAPAAQPEPRCECGDRESRNCPGAWEPGCSLGNSEEHAKVAPVSERSA
jgi:hypothetical protein